MHKRKNIELQDFLLFHEKIIIFCCYKEGLCLRFATWFRQSIQIARFHQLPDCQFPNKTNVKCNSKFVVIHLHEKYYLRLNKVLFVPLNVRLLQI